jgi:hypothetical protein
MLPCSGSSLPLDQKRLESIQTNRFISTLQKTSAYKAAVNNKLAWIADHTTMTLSLFN